MDFHYASLAAAAGEFEEHCLRLLRSADLGRPDTGQPPPVGPSTASALSVVEQATTALAERLRRLGATLDEGRSAVTTTEDGVHALFTEHGHQAQHTRGVR